MPAIFFCFAVVRIFRGRFFFELKMAVSSPKLHRIGRPPPTLAPMPWATTGQVGLKLWIGDRHVSMRKMAKPKRELLLVVARCLFVLMLLAR